MTSHPAKDCKGRDLQVGDWVRVIAVPTSIQGLPVDSIEAFSRAVGHTFQILEFEPDGLLHLELYPKISMDSIYIEPECVRRSRRYRKLSQAFRRRRAILEAPKEPRLGFDLEVHLKVGVDIEEICSELSTLGTESGFAVWPEQGRLRGSISVEEDDPEARCQLESARSAVAGHAGFRKTEISEIRRYPATRTERESGNVAAD